MVRHCVVFGLVWAVDKKGFGVVECIIRPVGPHCIKSGVLDTEKRNITINNLKVK
jgi:hypothetical protein